MRGSPSSPTPSGNVLAPWRSFGANRVRRWFATDWDTKLGLLLVGMIAAALVCVATVRVGASLAGPIAGEHSSRQAWTYSVAYNFAHETYNFFRPRHDWAEDQSGVVGMEPPIFPWVMSWWMRLAGDAPVWGRLLAFSCFFAGTVRFVALLKRRGGVALGLGAAIVLATSPLALLESRVIQPDPAALGLALLAADGLDLAAQRRSFRWGGVALVTFAIALLIKPVIVSVGLAALAFAIPRERLRDGRWIAFVCAGLVSSLLLYKLWHGWAEHLVATETAGVHRVSIEMAPARMRANLASRAGWDQIFGMLLPNYVLSFWLWPLALPGAARSLAPEHRRLGVPFLLWFLATAIVAGAFSDRYFSNWYYCIPFLPPLAYWAGLTLSEAFRSIEDARSESAHVWRRWALVFVVVCSLLAWRLAPLARFSHPYPTADLWTQYGGTLGLVGLAVASLAVAELVPRHVRVERALHGVLVVALVLGAFGAQRFAIIWFQRRMDVDRWAQIERVRQEALAAVSAVTSRDDRFVVSGANAVMLYRILRKGYADDAPAIDQRGIEFYRRHGVSFAFYFDDSGARPAAFRPLPKIAEGAGWTFYCVRPDRCGGVARAR